MNDDWSEAVLAFWFGELTPQDWYSGEPEIDAAIANRFGELHRRLSTAIPPGVMDDPRAALAAVIVYDQFPRNLYRRQAAAFATDNLAIDVAREAVLKGLDRDMTATEKQFLYMPFAHSEILAEQERGVDLFRTLGDDEAVKYAIEHRDIIARFGRFPHRNRALGRTSTAAETAFLENHSDFGQ